MRDPEMAERMAFEDAWERLENDSDKDWRTMYEVWRSACEWTLAASRAETIDAERYRWIRLDRTEDQTRQVLDIIIDNCEENMDEAIDAARLAAPTQGADARPVAITEAMAEEMGETGAPHSEAERKLYEAYCKGHCWAVGPWTGKEYYEMLDRIRFAMWRDRAALGTRDAASVMQRSVDAWDKYWSGGRAENDAVEFVKAISAQRALLASMGAGRT